MGGKGSGRYPKKERPPRPQTRECANPSCRRLMYIGRDGRKKYCSIACKQAAYRQRKRETADRQTVTE